MDQIRKTAQLKEKKKKEKEEKLRESLLQSKLSRASESMLEQDSRISTSDRIPAESYSPNRISVESTNLVIVKNLDTNEQETL